jgi:membrane fusion protein (multidrug efflux system)
MPVPTSRRPALACAALALLAAACSKEAPPPQRPVPQVTVITATPKTIPYVTTFVAQTESSRQVDIVARISGYLDRIAYREGELVKDGQVLFQIDPKPFQAQLDAAKGELLSQQARLETARSNLARIKPLAAQDAVSRADLDKAQGEFDSAKAAVFAAEAKVKEQQLNLGYTTIRAPVTGLASRAAQRQGAYINAVSEGAKLTYVAALDPMWVNFSVSQNQMAKIRGLIEKKLLVPPPGQNFEVELVMSDGSIYPDRGKISFADPSFSQETGSFLVRAVLPNPAVQQGSNGHLVYVVKQDGIAELRPVVVGDYQGEKDIVIQSGLRAGDRVVVDGALKVVPGQPVKIVEPGAQKEAAPAEPKK